MTSKFDRLRAGEIVEIEPGRKGRLNLQNKSFETSDGRTMYVGDDPDFFPPNEEYLKTSRERERVNKQVKGRVGGEFIHQFAGQGIAGAGIDWYNKLTQEGDDYLRTKKVKSEVSEKISERSPWTSAAATGASIGLDIAATRGMSALKAAPLLTAAHAGPRIIEEPLQVAGEAALSAAAGHYIDKGGYYLNKISKRRGDIQALPAQQEAVISKNVLGKQAVEEGNALKNQAYAAEKQNVINSNKDLMYQHGQELNARENKLIANKNFVAGEEAGREANMLAQKNQIAVENAQEKALKNNVRTINEARLEQHEIDLIAQKNKLIERNNARAEAKTLRDAEVVRLENEASLAKRQKRADQAIADREYILAKEAANAEEKAALELSKAENAAYQKSLKELPELQKKAQIEYGNNVVENAKNIEKNFPSNSKISSEEIGIDEFIDYGINKTGLGGSTEANQASKILKSIFPEGEFVSGKELAKRYKALEDAIVRSNPEVQNVLKEFKKHLGKKLPDILEDSVVYNKIIPSLRKSLSKDIETVLSEINFIRESGKETKEKALSISLNNARNILNYEITPLNFSKKLQNGELSRNIANNILTVEDFIVDYTKEEIISLKKKGLIETVFQDATQKHNHFVKELSDIIQKNLSRYEVKALKSARNARQKFSKEIKKTYGMAPEIQAPLQPQPITTNKFNRQPEIIPEAPAIQYPENIPHIANPLLPERPVLEKMGNMNKTVFQAPPNVVAPEIPPIPAKPQLMNDPNAPIMDTFNPQAIPELAAAQGFSDQAGDFLQKNLMGGRGVVNNPIAKLAGLKYLLGSAALPAELAYAGMKGLTSPTAAGEVARMTFKQGGIQAIESWAQKYPSYHDGILENPQERRALTKEIEDAYDIPLESKAILQSKVNRGKPLSQKL